MSEWMQGKSQESYEAQYEVLSAQTAMALTPESSLVKDFPELAAIL